MSSAAGEESELDGTIYIEFQDGTVTVINGTVASQGLPEDMTAWARASSEASRVVAAESQSDELPEAAR